VNKRSPRMEDKEKFVKIYDKCSAKTQAILRSLIQRITAKLSQTDEGFTNKPDYRIAIKEGFVFCELVPRQRQEGVEVILRVDALGLTTQKIGLLRVNDPSRPGKRWFKFLIREETEIEEALNLIDHVYKFRRKNSNR
jgi:hypothetical protein